MFLLFLLVLFFDPALLFTLSFSQILRSFAGDRGSLSLLEAEVAYNLLLLCQDRLVQGVQFFWRSVPVRGVAET